MLKNLTSHGTSTLNSKEKLMQIAEIIEEALGLDDPDLFEKIGLST